VPSGMTPKAGSGAHQPAGDLGDGSVPTGGNDHLFTAPGSLTRQSFGVPGAMGFGQIKPHSVGDEHIDGCDNEYWPTCADEYWPTSRCLIC
jgi:hypothetical protein